MEQDRPDPISKTRLDDAGTLDAGPGQGAPGGHQGRFSLPDRIGKYHIKRVIASGGMGTVLEAMQDSPRRPVAIKLLRPGVATPSVLRRFEYEAQVLARLRHPAIAQIYEAGIHEARFTPGEAPTPYFAMEYVPGARTLTEYAASKDLGVRARLELFGVVCDAVHHGHQRGVIHRDLKPGNILVDSSGQVKVIDFGVARAVNSDIAVTTMQTQAGQLVGTLQYMSPEQIEADPDDIDVRSDVYALGVVLYELLTGRPPYNLTRAPLHEAARVIKESAPTRLSTVSSSLRGDIETIVLKALEKERSRRYQSALELEQDIGRYLANEPITARQASVLYQFRVFARRNKALVGGAAAVLVVSAVGGVVSGVFALQAERARGVAVAAQMDAEAERAEAERQREIAEAARLEAEREAANAVAVNRVLREVFEYAIPWRSRGRDVTVLEAVEQTAARIPELLADRPEAEASVRDAVGGTLSALGLFGQAELHQSIALSLRRRELGDEHPETLRSMQGLAWTLQELGRREESIALAREAMEGLSRVEGEHELATAQAASNLAWQVYTRGDPVGAEELFRSAMRRFDAVMGPLSPASSKSRASLALMLIDQQRYEEAEAFAVSGKEGLERSVGAMHPDAIFARHAIGLLRLRTGRADEATAIYEEVSASAAEVMGADHPYRLFWTDNLGWAYYEAGRFEDAERCFREVYERRARVLPEGHEHVFTSGRGVAQSLLRMGRPDEAAALAAELHRRCVEAHGAAHTETRLLARVMDDAAGAVAER